MKLNKLFDEFKNDTYSLEYIFYVNASISPYTSLIATTKLSFELVSSYSILP